jgi:hypothetical protein
MTLHRKHGAGGHTSIDISSLFTYSIFLVKPVGSLQSVFMILSSYSARDERSTVNLEYGTVDDLSNVSILQLYAKLSLHKATVRPTGPLHVDVFPRRLDRKILPGRRLPAAWVELDDDDSIRRIAPGTLALGGLIRTRARHPISSHEHSAFRERLMDFAVKILFGALHLPAFLSSANYYWSLASGLIIPTKVYLDLTKENDTVSAWLHRPASSFSSMDDMICGNPALLAKKDLIYSTRKTQNVKPMAAVLFWDTPAMHTEFGPFTQLYRAMAE